VTPSAQKDGINACGITGAALFRTVMKVQCFSIAAACAMS
jgi:hypothetical protein